MLENTEKPMLQWIITEAYSVCVCVCGQSFKKQMFFRLSLYTNGGIFAAKSFLIFLSSHLFIVSLNRRITGALLRKSFMVYQRVPLSLLSDLEHQNLGGGPWFI